jgi:hypothetical protein
VRLAARGCVWSEGGVRVADPKFFELSDIEAHPTASRAGFLAAMLLQFCSLSPRDGAFFPGPGLRPILIELMLRKSFLAIIAMRNNFRRP